MSIRSFLRSLCIVDHPKQPTVFEIVKPIDNKPQLPTLEQAIANAKEKRRLEDEERERKERVDREFFEPYVNQINAIVPDLAQVVKTDRDWYYALQIGSSRFYVFREKIYHTNPIYSVGCSSEVELSKFIEEIGDIVSRNEGYKLDDRFLPCPFCGHSVIRIEGDTYYAAHCNGCNIIGSLHRTFDDVLAAWNKRVAI